jgi:outer membrane lipoprotein-sorting protein
MKPTDDLEKVIKQDLNFTAGAELHGRMLNDVLNAQEKSRKASSAISRPNLGRTIMKSRITKLAAAAVIIALVVLGLFEFVKTENTSGVVWAQVAEKVDASRGSIVRCRETSSFLPNEDDYSIKYFSPTRSRTDTYKGGQITNSYYTDFEAKTYTGVHHMRKHYLSITITPSKGGFLEKQEDWMNPRYLVQKILSCEHRKLGQKTIEGVLCEGIETTDPGVMGPLPGPVSRLDVEMRLWVDAKTEYPALFEAKIHAEAEGKTMSSQSVMDQFQWDVELDPNLFVPNIPSDYTDMRNL